MSTSGGSAALKTISLYGPPAVGKSALGRELARSLRLPFHDLDAEIEAQADLTIPEIFAQEGEGGFRARERDALDRALAPGTGVIALGGGALLDPEGRAKVEAAGPVICLTAPFETLRHRLDVDDVDRPLLAGDAVDRLRSLLAQRAAHYSSFSLRLDTGALQPAEAAWEAMIRLGWFHLASMGAGYDVRVTDSLLDSLGHTLQLRGLEGPVALVSDETVSGLYGDQASGSLSGSGFDVCRVTIPPGEEHKMLATANQLWAEFLAGGLERGSTVVALGGGVVGDLAGFAAAAYLRGVSWCAVPTTLLAMVDASLGGKTGVDLPEGKNLVGAFHPPRLVLTDPAFLATLPDEELRAGMAEVVKHGVIGDPALFALCEQGWDALAADWGEVVRRAMAVKVQVIEEDPYEKGLRAALNLGHTVGHAVELASRFALRHGEAVAIGLVAEAWLAAELDLAPAGLPERLAAVLIGLGLPVEAPAGLDRAAILQAMQVDKKKARGQVRFALPEQIGRVRTGVVVEDLEWALDVALAGGD